MIRPSPSNAYPMNKHIKQHFEETWLTTKELAEYTGLKETTIKQRAARHKIDCVLKGRTWLFYKLDFQPKREVLPIQPATQDDSAAGK